MYLISKDQFIDVVRQETSTTKRLNLDFGRAIANGSMIFKRPSWYGNLVYLGERGDFPIFTFTSENDFLNTSRPSEKYLRIISRGIQESYQNLSPEEIAEYLILKEGVRNNYSKDTLMKICGLGSIT